MDTDSPTPLGKAIPLGDLFATEPRNRRDKRRRDKIFGHRFGRSLDRNEKARITAYADWLWRHNKGQPDKPQLTRAILFVLKALLWDFHNQHSGLCFPSYERIAEAANCARSSVAEAIQILERAGILTWVNCIKRVRQTYTDLFGRERVRIIPVRTSNAYAFGKPPNSPKSEKRTGTSDQGLSLTINRSLSTETWCQTDLFGSLTTLGEKVRARNRPT